MENTDSYPCFHTRLVRTYRRRFTGAGGQDAGYLILNAADQFVEIIADASAVLAARDEVRSPIPGRLSRFPRRVPGEQCPVPGCSRRHDDLDDGDDPPLVIPTQR